MGQYVKRFGKKMHANQIKRIFTCLGALVFGFATGSGSAEYATDPARKDDRQQRILIGIEYCIIEDADLNARLAEIYGELGIPMAKHFPEHVSWGHMQKRRKSPIDFTRLDNFVREYQKSGFTELIVCLRSLSKWATKDPGMLFSRNMTPKPEYMDLYEKWIYSVVERYDGDGKDDMPGLIHPVSYLEIGSEFSSYEPEPVDDYLEMLSHAYQVAHRANADIKVGHAAFLTTGAFIENPSPEKYEEAFAAVPPRIMTHSLSDIRKILDCPDIFDVINIHNLGDPYEIESMMEWLSFEMKMREYRKPVIISDTVPTSFIGWGPATTCKGPREQLGLIGPPATEADRCRLADFFTRLVSKDLPTLRWVQGFVAQDMVQRTIIAAEQGVELINLAFTGDPPFLQGKFFRASAGLSAWSGMIGLKPDRTVDYRPLFYAIKQMNGHLKDYQEIQRVNTGNGRIRLYEIKNEKGNFWIAWLDPGRLILPEDEVPESMYRLDTGCERIQLQKVITEYGFVSPVNRIQMTAAGLIDLKLSPVPQYVIPDQK